MIVTFPQYLLLTYPKSFLLTSISYCSGWRLITRFMILFCSSNDTNGRQISLDWSEDCLVDWIGLDWIGLDWIGLDRIE